MIIWIFCCHKDKKQRKNKKKYNGGNQFFPELRNCALIRELHVYGQVVAATRRPPAAVADTRNSSTGSGIAPPLSVPQHQGLGRRLMQEAEQISQQNNYRKLN